MKTHSRSDRDAGTGASLLFNYAVGPETAGATAFSAVSPGDSNSCASISSVGGVQCWSRNSEDQAHAR